MFTNHSPLSGYTCEELAQEIVARQDAVIVFQNGSQLTCHQSIFPDADASAVLSALAKAFKSESADSTLSA